MITGVALHQAARQRGFTLTELLVVVVIAAVLAAVALPNLSEFVQNNARATRLNNLVAAFNLARSDAVTRRRQARVCASADGATCSGNEFQNSVLIHTSPDGAAWTLLRVFPGDGSASHTIVGDVSQVTFLPTGLTSGGVANTKFVHCDSRGAESARAVVLSATGHPRISEDTNSDGTDDVNGVALTCP